ncbi:ATP-grasp domain-containing protein [Corynebacterium sp. 4HC-13]|uniref:ATP-binding protein n=1 Tax=Corynebacterium anserum TaxID=2684406 RepID=UPI00163A9E46|nr:biotin carboxylase N-terminal domain-containing protein [Corynebacterium anserum]MBC2681865.1 ATP-grasp domain-containing protein [Corynebacterium anserum]
MITRILVANRGEIAARIIRTVHDLGLKAIAVYAEADINSPAVELADEAYSLGAGTAQETYLNLEKILQVAKEADADAIHPGYGFLSEVAEVAAAVVDAGLVWIGPSAHTIEQLGDKISARRTANAAAVQPVPGTNDPVDSMDTVRDFVATHGLPIVAKRSDGGGGRGIEIMRTDRDVEEFGARHADADGTGGDLGAYFLEKFVENGRHVETQCMADAHGNFAVVSTRDCSVQRRNQKLIEEAPAPFLSTAALSKLSQWSENLFRHTGYQGLGTCEFLVKGEDVYFLEVNPRLQVEHTVSEEITGLDMVTQQIRIANGEALCAVPDGRGHSVELRITSEDPGADLTPTAGTITELAWPTGHGVRVETGVRQGDVVTPDFDSMIAKLIITGPDRPTTLSRCLRALRELRIEGVATPQPLIEQILTHRDFAATTAENFAVGTKWMEEVFLPAADIPAAFSTGKAEEVSSTMPSRKDVVIEIDGRRHALTLPADIFAGVGGLGGRVSEQRPAQPRRGSSRRLEAAPAPSGDGSVGADGVLASPMQAIVVRLPVQPGQEVNEGDVLIVLEAMKMEKYIHSTVSGVVEEILVDVSQNVPAGTPLLRVAVKDTTNPGEEV